VLSIERFASMAREIETKHVLFLFDSCFSGARGFALSVASPADLTSIITQRTAESVRQFISSGTADQRVPDTSEFRRQFVMALDGEADRNGDGHVTGSELGVFLQEKVTSYTRGTQTPQYGKILDPDLDKGDFVFPASSTLPPPLIISPPAELKPTLANSVGMEFVLIPAAEFTMGADDSPSLRPSHRVTISQPFYLGKYEVTQAQWVAIMGKNPSRFTGDPHLPVENVSWNEVQEFIRQLNTREGATRYRLPTEAEWEHAASAGVMTTHTFGNDAAQLGQYAWYDENADKRTHAVGQLKPNTWGLYDTLGNVWEWCQDWYGDYPQRAAVDPQGTPQGAFRVYRGCGWHRGASTLYCQVASRHGARPSFRHPALGFRLLLMVRPEKTL
jgi:formylglycine-generating enzyme required for sulfatase activity